MKVHLFGISYLIAYIGYSSVGSMYYALYREYGIENIVLVAGIFTFIGFGIFNAFIIHLLKKINLRKAVLIGFTGYMIYEAVIMMTILVTQAKTPIISSLPFLYIINSISGLIAGFSSAIIWIANPIYIQMVNRGESMTAKMGLFWSIYTLGTVIGGLINTFVLGYISTFFYLMVVLACSFLSLSSAYFFILPLEIEDQNKHFSMKQEMRNIIKTVTDHFANIFVFSFLCGLVLSYYTVFINKIIVMSLPEDSSQQYIQRMTGIIFICQGLSVIGTGLALRLPFYSKLNKEMHLKISLIFLQFNFLFTTMSINLLNHQENIFWISIIIMATWAITQIHMKTGIDIYIREYHEGKVQYYSIALFLYSLGSVCSMLILMIDDYNISLLVMGVVAIMVSILWMGRSSLLNKSNQQVMKTQTNEREIQLIELTSKLIVYKGQNNQQQ